MRNNNIRPETWKADTVDISKKAKAEAYLLGAMFRQPYLLHEHLARLSPVCLSNATDGLAPAFLEILRQYGDAGTFSPLTIETATGLSGLSSLSAADPDLDLAWAVDTWQHEYGVWAEQMAYSHAAAQRHLSVNAMRAAVEEMRERLGANGAEARMGGADEFLKWGEAKIAGKVERHKTEIPLESLAKLIPAFEPGYMWVLAGRPGMGKTQMALNLLSGFVDNGAHGLFFSIEMTSPDIYRRLLGIRHGINPKGDWSMADGATLQKALREVGELKINVIDNVAQLAEIEAICVTANHRRKLDYIFVDYLGLVVPNGKHGSREREVASISEALTRLAKRLKVAVIAIAQLSRANETRGGSKRPMLSDLRDSGGIEQDAGGVVFLHRPEYYGFMEDENGLPTKGRAELIVAKHRNGETGIQICGYKPGRGFFDEPEAWHQTVQARDVTISNRAEPEDGLPF